MAKFCGNCGAQSEDNAVVCGNCGAPFEAVAATPAANPMDKVTGALKNNNIVKYVVMGVAAILVVVLLFVGIGAISGGPEKTAKKYLKYVLTEKFDKVEKLYPDFVLEEYDDRDFDVADGAEEMFDELDEGFDDELGDYKTSVEILDVDIYDKDNDYYNDFIDALEDADFEDEAEKVKAIAKVSYEITAKDGKEYTTYNDTLTLIKYKGSWKLAGFLG